MASWPAIAATRVVARAIAAAAVVLASVWLAGCATGVGPRTPGRVAPRGPGSAAPLSPGQPPSLASPPAGRRIPAARTRPQGLPVVIDHGRRDLPLAAITFDSNMTDGMLRRLDTGAVGSYDDTAAVAELIRLRVPATFFVAGKWALRYPAQTRLLAANPLFELASHSWSHDAFATPCYGLPPIPLAAMAADVRRSFAVLRRFTSHPAPYFRFPGGCYNAAALRAVAPTGVSVVQYDVISGDAFGTSVRAIVTHTLAAAGNGSIIVMHITLANAPLTPLALPRIVAGLRARGITLVKLSDLLAAGN